MGIGVERRVGLAVAGIGGWRRCQGIECRIVGRIVVVGGLVVALATAAVGGVGLVGVVVVVGLGGFAGFADLGGLGARWSFGGIGFRPCVGGVVFQVVGRERCQFVVGRFEIVGFVQAMEAGGAFYRFRVSWFWIYGPFYLLA
jgi:hypothetical protein